MTRMPKRAYFPGKTGVRGAQNSDEDFGPSDFGLVRCSKSTLKGSIIGFSGPKMSFLVLISGDFYEFLQKSSDFVPDRKIDLTFNHTCDP